MRLCSDCKQEITRIENYNFHYVCGACLPRHVVAKCGDVAITLDQSRAIQDGIPDGETDPTLTCFDVIGTQKVGLDNHGALLTVHAFRYIPDGKVYGLLVKSTSEDTLDDEIKLNLS